MRLVLFSNDLSCENLATNLMKIHASVCIYV